MKRFAPFVIVAAAGLGTLIGGAWLYRAKCPPGLPSLRVRMLMALDSLAPAHVRGQSDAPVAVEEFGDLQCPPCRTLAEPIKQLETDHPGHVYIVFREFPLAIHPHAREAAYAAEAAGLQGHFWEMHDLLYREQRAWSATAAVRPLFDTYAGTLGLDVERFKRDLDGAQVQARVAADEQRGMRLGVSKTPMIFVNAVAVPPGSLQPEPLRKIVETAIHPPAGR